MGVSYKKLWKLLIDKEMTRTDLRIAVGASSSTFAKLSKDEYISFDLMTITSRSFYIELNQDITIQQRIMTMIIRWLL